MNRSRPGRVGRWVLALVTLMASCTAEPVAVEPTPTPAVLRATGSALRPAATIRSDDPCSAPDGWEPGPCVVADTSAVSSARRFEGGAIPVWRVRTWTIEEDGWSLVSEATGPADTWAEVTIAGWTEDTIVVGYRYGGSGAVLDYDVIVDGSVVAHRSGLEHAAVVLGEERIDEYAAVPGGPTCCPEAFVHTRLRRHGDTLRADVVGNVSTDERPPSDL